MWLIYLDDSLRSPFGPTFSRSMRFALLSDMCRDDERVINQNIPKIMFWE